jgi:general stress protein YciG
MEEKRSIYKALQEKLRNGVVLSEKQQQVYQLLSRQFGEEIDHPAVPQLPGERRQEVGKPLGGQDPAPRLIEDGGQEQPAPQLVEELDENRVGAANGHVPGGIQQPPVLGGQNNNEQEEVKDLVEGGQQKPGVFENVKEHQPEEAGAAGGDPNVGVELQDLERNNKPLGDEAKVEAHDDPIPKPVADPPHHADPEPLAREQRKANVDDDEDDVGDYGAVQERENKNAAINEVSRCHR